MTQEEIAAQELANQFKAKLETAQTEIKSLGEVSKQTAGELKAAVELGQKQAEQIKLLSEQNNAIEAEQKRLKEAGNSNETKTFLDTLQTEWKAAKWLDGNEKRNIILPSFKKLVSEMNFLERKANEMTRANTFASGVLVPMVLPGAYAQPTMPTTIANLFRVGAPVPMGKSSVQYNREVLNSYTDNTGYKPEGSHVTNSKAEIEAKVAYLQTLQGLDVTSRETVMDLNEFLNFLQMKLVNYLAINKEKELLDGTGAVGHIEGVRTNAPVFVPKMFSLVDVGWIEIMINSVLNVGGVYHLATDFIMNPVDAKKLLIEKDDNKAWKNLFFIQNGVANFIGIPITESYRMASGQFFCGDFARGCMVMPQGGTQMSISDQDGENFKDGNYTVKLEERLLLEIFYQQAFVKGDYATAKAALEAAASS